MLRELGLMNLKQRLNHSQNTCSIEIGNSNRYKIWHLTSQQVQWLASLILFFWELQMFFSTGSTECLLFSGFSYATPCGKLHVLQCNNLVQESCIMISNDLNHDHHLVHAFQKAVSCHLKKTRHLKINKMYRFSDGSSSQYKSRGPFSDISYAYEDYKYPILHNYFGTRHGKGASDGEGAVVKSQASQAVLAGTAIIRDAQSL